MYICEQAWEWVCVWQIEHMEPVDSYKSNDPEKPQAVLQWLSLVLFSLYLFPLSQKHF